jgi:transcriptional antiterminator NusG
VTQAEPVAADEEDLMAERESDEQAQDAQPQETAEPRVEASGEEAARPPTPAPDAPEMPSDEVTPEPDAAGMASKDEPVGATESGKPVQEESETSAPVLAESDVPAPTAADNLESVEASAPEAETLAQTLPAEPPAEAQAPSTAAGDVPLAEVPATAAGEAAPTEAPSEAAWYVIHCYSGYENKVRHNLEQRIETMGMKDKIFDVVIPTQEEIEVKEGKRRTVERHIFPGYVLVQMALTEESWYVVRNTPGVTGFVGMGNLPTALRPEEVAQIVKRMEAEAPTVKVSFKLGERVRIIDGPFNDFRGTVSDIDMERTKVRVMVSFFGRETPVELDFLQVEKS